MTDCNTGWGGILAGGLVGYLVGANGGGLFGNNNCGRNNCGCGCEDRHHGYDEAKLNDIMNGQDTKAILDATIAGDSQVRADIGALTKDVYELNIQQLINGQSEQRNIDNQFCKTREFVAADGTATRAAIGAFETRYLEDRIHDRDLMIAKLQNELVAAPLACGLAAVNAKLDSVMCPGAVKTCGSGCGSSCGFPTYAVPPVGTFNIQKSYNPSIPTA
jgi:hypothetical protein